MRSRGIIGAVATAAALAFAGPAAAGTLDQEQTAVTTSVALESSQSGAAQTFTAGRTGLLTQADLALHSDFAYTPLRVAVRRVGDDGVPGDELGAEEIEPDASAAMSFRSVAFDPPIYLQGGYRYALQAVNTNSDYRNPWFWGGATGDPYAGGTAFRRFESLGLFETFAAQPDLDLAFRTYMDPPPQCTGVRIVLNGHLVCP